MGDRCYYGVTFSLADEARVCEVLDLDPSPNYEGANYDLDEKDHTAHAGIEEASPQDVEEKMEEAKIPYLAWHSAGYEYGPHVIAFDGKEGIDLPSDWENIGPIVTIERHGEPEPGPMESALKYWAVYERVEAYFKSKKPNGGRDATEEAE